MTESDSAAQEIAAEQRYLDLVYQRLAELRRSAAETEKAGYRIARVGTFGALVERDAMVYHAARRRRTLDAEHEGLVFGRLDLHPSGGDSDLLADGTTDGLTDGSTGTTEPEADGNAPAALDDADNMPAVLDDAGNVPAVLGGADAERAAAVLAERAAAVGEVRYIGRLGLRDERYRSLVVDWRAPAAAPFYRATPTDRMGVIRRRTIRSLGEQVIGVEDDLLDPDAAPPGMPVIGDGALLAGLARTTGTGMRDIVATIQREQDEAIRAPASGVTIVQGGPGTGKTAVALHRAAYLLYSDRNRFESGGVLVIGPSEFFVSYVGRVLPSLGEDTVTLRSLGQLVDGVSTRRYDPADLAAIKGSLRMRRVLSRAARDEAPDTPHELRLLYRGVLLRLDQRALEEARRTVLSGGGRRNAVRAKAAGLLLDLLWRQSNQLLPGYRQQKRAEFATDTAERREFTSFMRGWWPRLQPLDVLGWLADRHRLRRYAAGTLSDSEQARLAASLAGPADRSPTVADVALLDELAELLGTPPAKVRPTRDPFHVAEGVRELSTHADRMAAARAVAVQRAEDYRDYAHVVVDEAQDVSPMQWRMIGRRGQHASWTIVGDPAQAAWADVDEAAEAMTAALGTRRRHEFALHTNYRNSAEIFELAAAVARRNIPGIDLPTAVRSTGVPPEHVFTDRAGLTAAVRTAVADVLRRVPGTVGVITAMDRRSELGGWLAEQADDRLQVVGSLEAKGMEYDGVVLVEPADVLAESAAGARTLYVALSRATQLLVTVATDRSWLPPATTG